MFDSFLKMAKRGRKCFSVGQIIKSQWFKPWTHGRRSIEKWSFRTRKSVPWNWLGCEIGEQKTPTKIVPCFSEGNISLKMNPVLAMFQVFNIPLMLVVLMFWCLGHWVSSIKAPHQGKNRHPSMCFFPSLLAIPCISSIWVACQSYPNFPNQWSSYDLCNDRIKWLVHTPFCKFSKYLPPISSPGSVAPKKNSPQFKLVKHRGLALSCNGAQSLLEAAGFVMKDDLELEVRGWGLEVWSVDSGQLMVGTTHLLTKGK